MNPTPTNRPLILNVMPQEVDQIIEALEQYLSVLGEHELCAEDYSAAKSAFDYIRTKKRLADGE